MPAHCQYCGQSVTGSYIQALGATWHPEHFLCAGCGRPLSARAFKVSEGRPYHDACYVQYQAPRCADCGQPISGAYTLFNGQPYHSTCYLEHVVPRCTYCQKPLTGSYLIDGWGNSYCSEHEKQYPACSFCGRLIAPRQQTPGWNSYDSQRCPVCRSTAIESVEQAQPSFQQCKQWISQQGFRFNQLPLRLELHDTSWLAALWPDQSVPHPRGVTLTTITRGGNGYMQSKVEGVAVLQGMPAALFCGVVVHELGHVWLAVHQVTELPHWAEEGFCELLAWRYYNHLDTPEARYYAKSMQESQDPIYGEGFRRVSLLSQRMGFARLVETLGTTKKLPL